MQVLMQLTNNLFGLPVSDVVTIITTIAIVVANSVVTLYIYFRSQRPNFAIDKFQEAGVWKIGIHNGDKPIPRCSVTLNSEPLIWVEAFNNREIYIAAGGGSNVTIPNNIQPSDEDKICVRSNGKNRECFKFSAIQRRS